MYQDEQLQNLSQLGEKGMRQADMAFRAGQNVVSLLERQLSRPKPAAPVSSFNANQPFVFSGQYTDLCYFIKNPHMAFSEINDIDNPDLRDAVLDNFNRAYKEGHITVDENSGIISLTDKGENYISGHDFQKAAKNDQSRTLAEMRESMANERNTAVETVPEVQEFYLQLDGTDNDLAYFTHADTLDVSAISNSPDVVEKFAEFESSGAIMRQGDEYVLTDNGRELANAPV